LKRTTSYPPKKPVSRWESECSKTPLLTNCTLPIKMPIRVQAPVEVVGTLTSVGTIPASTCTNSNCLPTKPVRRHSIDDPDELARLHESLSSLNNDTTMCMMNRNKKTTAEMLAKALESLDLYDEEDM
jgi:hypothetical protein